jgi:hypothetical protein
MQSYHEVIQNYFKSNTIIQFPSKEEVKSLTTIVVRLSQNHYFGPEYIKSIFEINLQLGTIEKITTIVNSLKSDKFQYLYIIKFNHVFAENAQFIYFCDILLKWGYYDMNIVFDENNIVNIRVFYDDYIESHNKTKQLNTISGFGFGSGSGSVPVYGCSSLENIPELLNLTEEKNNSKVRENYEQFKSIIETDINALDEKNKALIKELNDTKKNLQDTKTTVDELKDQLKWTNKIFSQKVKQLKLDLQDDFKKYVETSQSNGEYRRGWGSRGSGRNSTWNNIENARW